MGTIPTIPTFVAGSVLTAAQLNQLKTVSDFWAAPPRCQAVDAAGPTLTTGVTATVALGAENFDVVQTGDTGMHDLVTTNSRVFARTAGKYRVTGYLSFASNATGTRQGTLVLNGVTNLVADARPASPSTSTNMTIGPKTVTLAVGDFIELTAFQTSGGNLALNLGNPGPSTLTVELLSA